MGGELEGGGAGGGGRWRGERDYLPCNLISFGIMFESYGEIPSVVELSERGRFGRPLLVRPSLRRTNNLSSKQTSNHQNPLYDGLKRSMRFTVTFFMLALVVNPSAVCCLPSLVFVLSLTAVAIAIALLSSAVLLMALTFAVAVHRCYSDSLINRNF